MSESSEAAVSLGAPDWRRELDQRLALATPKDVLRGLLFNSMLQMIQTLGDAAAMERCLEASGERRFIDLFNYPVSALIRLTYTAGHELAPRYGGFEGALRRMGQQGMVDLLGSGMGRALKHLAGQDVRTLVDSIQTLYRMTLSYGTRRVVWEGPRRGRLLLQRNFIPFLYHEEALRTLLAQMSPQSVRVVGRQTAPLDSEYVFSWE